MKPWGRIDWKHWRAMRAWLVDLGQPWEDEAAIQDLRYWAAVREARDGGDRRAPRPPGYRQLMRDWRWTEHRTRALMRSESTWQDPYGAEDRSDPRLQAAMRTIAKLEKALAKTQGPAGDASKLEGVVDKALAEIRRAYPPMAEEVLGRKVGKAWGGGAAFRRKITKAVKAINAYAKNTQQELDPVAVLLLLVRWVMYSPSINCQGYRKTNDPVQGHMLGPRAIEKNIQAALDWELNGSRRASPEDREAMSDHQKKFYAEAYALTEKALARGRQHRTTAADFPGRDDADALVAATRAICQDYWGSGLEAVVKKTWLGVYQMNVEQSNG